MQEIQVIGWPAICAVLVAVMYACLFFMKSGGLEAKSVLPKCAGSFLCVITAAFGVLSTGENPFFNPIVIALILCMIGDFLIEYQMIWGGIAFAGAHLLLIFWAVLEAPVSWVCLPVFIVCMGVTIWLFYPNRRRMGGKAAVYLIYAVLLIADLSVAAALSVTSGWQYLPFALGLLCFVASDLILGKQVFGRPSMRKQKLLMALYYLALYLIALTPLILM